MDCRDGAGGRRVETYATKEAAEDAFARIIPESRQAIMPPVDRDITIDEYAKRWLQIASELKPRTVQSYGQQIRLHRRDPGPYGLATPRSASVVASESAPS